MNKSRRSRLSRSSRVSEKVMEYYMKYGKDRELEKFMRFRSPGGGTSTTSTSSSEDWTRMGNLGCLFQEREINSEERRVNISGIECKIASTSSGKKEHFVAIQIEGDYSDDNEAHEKIHIPIVQSPKTPQSKQLNTKQTQTPESVAKSHKRLEWDSLGDVGYKKSKSTSNVSIVERMLLREFFEVTTNASKNINSSESDIRLLEQEIADLGTLRKHFTKPTPTMEESNYGTPPLASSTHVECKSKVKKPPPVYTVGTNTSISQEKIEKFAQTSLRNPQTTSKEVQVTLSPPSISPLLGSSAEPSSFEYRSRLSTNSSGGHSTKSTSKQSRRVAAGEEHATPDQMSEIQLQQKPLSSQNDNSKEAEVCERLKNLFISWNNAMEENKENTSTTSSSCSNGSNTPQIDLGIQLICGIMKAKNIDQKQKKRLVRNIVKKITKIANSCELDAIVSRTATLIESSKENTAVNQLRQQADKKVTAPAVSKPSSSVDAKDKNMHSKREKVSSHSISEATNKNFRQEQGLPSTNRAGNESKKYDKDEQSEIPEKRSSNITGSTVETHSSTSTTNQSDHSYSFKALPALPARSGKPQSQTNIPETSTSTSTTSTTKASSSSSSSNNFCMQNPPKLDIKLCICKTDSGGKLVGALISKSDSNALEQLDEHVASPAISKTQSETTSSTTRSDSTKLTSSSSKSLTTEKIVNIPYSSSKALSVDISADLSYSSKALPAAPVQLKANVSESSIPSTTTTTNASSSSLSNVLGTQRSPLLDIKLCVCKTESGGKLVGALISKPGSQTSSSTTQGEPTKPSSTSSSSSPKNLSTPKAKSAPVPEPVREPVLALISKPGSQTSSSTTQGETTKPSSSSSSSKNLSTPKAKSAPVQEPVPVPVQNANNGTMQEWLNPMTQSEVEFEDKKRKIEARKKGLRHSRSSKSTKYVELNWIDCEIERLQKLKSTLLNERVSISGGSDLAAQSPAIESSDKLYDTVYSDASTGNAEKRVVSPARKKIPALTNMNTACKCTQTECVPKRPKSPRVTEKDAQQQCAPPQRSKMDTPTGSNGSESVGSFVRQRKQEFLEHYKSQKLNHYDQIMQNHTNERPSTSTGAKATSKYPSNGIQYSVDVPIQYQQPKSYYTYPPTHQPYRDACYYTQSLSPAIKQASSNMPTKTSRESSTEISVPMGSYNSSSIPTTSHQYDLATADEVRDKANIGSQTGHSLRHTRPIYETRCLPPYDVCTMVPYANYVACRCIDVPKTACIQARPKGISYSLQFVPKSPKKRQNKDNDSVSTSNEEYKTLDNASAPNLQVALKRGNPQFLEQAKKRKSVLNRIQKLRQEREQQLREIADENTSLNSLDRKLDRLPPPVTEQLRLFPTKQMKAMTNKRVAKLPEVLANQEREREIRSKRSNRLLREVFNRRLRQRVRGGKLTLNHSLTLI